MLEWPLELLLVRHGESEGNVARDRALAGGVETIDISWPRDCDVPLSARGKAQAVALGEWLATRGAAPDIILCSPYVRALETAQVLREAAGWPAVPLQTDERLREKEFGALNRLTRAGIAHRYPKELEARNVLGKFYYRPPGGESWIDVILRLRSVVQSLCLQYAGRRVLVASHQVIVLCFRYILEAMNEEQLLAIDREGDVANCSLTAYTRDRNGLLQLAAYNAVAPATEETAGVTTEPSQPRLHE